MDIINIKSINGLENLEKGLKSLNLQYKVNNVNALGITTDCTVNVLNDEDFLTLSIYLSYEVIFMKLKKMNERKYTKLNSEEIQIKSVNEFQSIIETFYYPFITRVLITKYLLDFKAIDLDTFVLFNMNCFENDYIKFTKKDLGMISIKEIPSSLVKYDYMDEDILKLLLEIKDDCLKSGMIFDVYEQVDIFVDKNNFITKLTDGRSLDKNYLENIVGYRFSIHGYENNKMFPNFDIEFFPILFSIIFFNTKKIVFHNDDNMKLRIMVRKELEIYNLEDMFDYKLITCNE